ncbi:MAG: dihydroorotate dehydrogenase electron transfer subunit [Spirochaetales bacterium]
MKQFLARVLENPVIAKDYRELFLSWPSEVRVPAPGQILSVRVNAATVPFLRRPFAVASFDRRERVASIIYHVRGPGTEILAGVQAGQQLDILGPRGFFFRDPPRPEAVLVGGGVGTGPIVYAANSLAEKGFSPLLVVGYRGQELAPRLRLNPAVTLQLCTDDGSAGFSGTVVEFLKTLSSGLTDKAFVWACGPQPMLKAVHLWTRSREVPCWVSLEEIMACGVGACMGCTVETTDERRVVRVCTEGPVLASEAVKWT